jgi:transposase
MNQHAIEFAAFVGIDWADTQHAVGLLPASPEAGLARYEAYDLPQRSEEIEAWAAELRTRFGGRPVAVCLEQSRGALIYALMKYDFLVLFPINPKQLARYREALVPSGAKDDPTDARRLTEFVASYHARLRPWHPDDATTRAIRLLVEGRRKLVDLRTALGNQLQQHLKEYFPLALELAGAHPYDAWFLRLLGKFPTLKDLQRAAPRTLQRLLPRKRRVSDDPPDDPRVAIIRAAQPLVTDSAVILAGKLAVQSLVAQLVQLNQGVAQYDRELAQLMAEHPDAALFQLPGARAAMAPRLLAAFGTDRDRFASARDIQQLSGIAPVTIRSGKSLAVRRRRACPKFLRQTFHEFAQHSLKRSRWALAYYRLLRAKGKGRHAAFRALAFKWIRILFRCWQNRTPYDESLYLQRLETTHSPILEYLTPQAAT